MVVGHFLHFLHGGEWGVAIDDSFGHACILHGDLVPTYNAGAQDGDLIRRQVHVQLAALHNRSLTPIIIHAVMPFPVPTMHTHSATKLFLGPDTYIYPQDTGQFGTHLINLILLPISFRWALAKWRWYLPQHWVIKIKPHAIATTLTVGEKI